MSLPQLIAKLGETEKKRKSLLEGIKARIREYGIPVTTNDTPCKKPNCWSCKLGFRHGTYFLTRDRWGRRRRIRRNEVVPFLLKFVSKDLVEDFVKLQSQRAILVRRINAIVRWHEEERRNLTRYLRYASPTDFYALYESFQSAQVPQQQSDPFQAVVAKGKKVLARAIDYGLDWALDGGLERLLKSLTTESDKVCQKKTHDGSV